MNSKATTQGQEVKNSKISETELRRMDRGNLSGYTILPKYGRSTRPSLVSNNNNYKYQQLQNKPIKRQPLSKTAVLSHDDTRFRSQSCRYESPGVAGASSTASKLGPSTAVDGGKSSRSFNGGVHSDGLLETRRRIHASPPSLSPDADKNKRRIRDDATHNPDDKSTSASVLSQARHSIWPPCHSTDAASKAPLQAITWQVSEGEKMTLPPSLHASVTTSDEAAANQVHPATQPQREHRRLATDDVQSTTTTAAAAVGDTNHKSEEDSDVRPFGVVIKKKYTTGLILGRYKSEPKYSAVGRALPGRRLRRHETTTGATASPNRRRDIFRSSSPELHCFQSDSTTGLVGARSSIGLTSPRMLSSTTVDSSNDYMSLPLIKPTATDRLSGSNDADELSKCQTRRQKCLSCCKSFVEFLFSTIGLFCCLVGYVCVGGIIFQRLESPNEKRINREMKELREAKVKDLWQVTEKMNVLHPDNWTRIAEEILETYTLHVFNSVKKLGWDGKDDEDSQDLQWSFAGSLLYSITVITTIGYGHIAPKTDWGRIVTMLYAIIGIPLTLLTITNLGGFMATAFRFLYRNICCRLICAFCRNKTRLQNQRKSANRQLVLMGRTAAATTIPPPKSLRKEDPGNLWWKKDPASDGSSNPAYYSPSSFLPTKPPTLTEEQPWSTTDEPLEVVATQPQPLNEGESKKEKISFWKKHKLKRSWTENEKDKEKDKNPVIYSKSFDGSKATETDPSFVHHLKQQQQQQQQAKKRRKHRDDSDDFLESPESRRLPWRQRFDDIFNTDDIKQVKVPILVSLMLITGYIGLGALLFSFWEKDWSYLIGCYFCFVTLSTIGFGDYVPGTSADDWNNQAKLVLCAMYLFVGLALIAMCFDLMLEQVRCKFRKIGRCLGILDDGGRRKKMKKMKMKKTKTTKMED